MFKAIIVTVLVGGFFAANVQARPSCLKMGKKAAVVFSRVINHERDLNVVSCREVSDSRSEQVFDVTFDTDEGAASRTYEVTVRRNPSPSDEKQVCLDVQKIELVGEE